MAVMWWNVMWDCLIECMPLHCILFLHCLGSLAGIIFFQNPQYKWSNFCSFMPCLDQEKWSISVGSECSNKDLWALGIRNRQENLWIFVCFNFWYAPGTPNNQVFFYGCFNWMIPNHYIKNAGKSFTKHPWKKMVVWGTNGRDESLVIHPPCWNPKTLGFSSMNF